MAPAVKFAMKGNAADKIGIKSCQKNRTRNIYVSFPPPCLCRERQMNVGCNIESKTKSRQLPGQVGIRWG